MIRTSALLRNIFAILVVMALAVRVLVPSGWMPSGERAFALTLCAGMESNTVWLTRDGKIHKEDPSKGKAADHAPCAFAGNAAALDTPVELAIIIPPNHGVDRVVHTLLPVAVGRGLAAPPPPAIGPPVLV